MAAAEGSSSIHQPQHLDLQGLLLLLRVLLAIGAHHQTVCVLLVNLRFKKFVFFDFSINKHWKAWRKYIPVYHLHHKII